MAVGDVVIQHIFMSVDLGMFSASAAPRLPATRATIHRTDHRPCDGSLRLIITHHLVVRLPVVRLFAIRLLVVRPVGLRRRRSRTAILRLKSRTTRRTCRQSRRPMTRTIRMRITILPNASGTRSSTRVAYAERNPDRYPAPFRAVPEDDESEASGSNTIAPAVEYPTNVVRLFDNGRPNQEIIDLSQDDESGASGSSAGAPAVESPTNTVRSIGNGSPNQGADLSSPVPSSSSPSSSTLSSDSFPVDSASVATLLAVPSKIKAGPSMDAVSPTTDPSPSSKSTSTDNDDLSSSPSFKSTSADNDDLSPSPLSTATDMVDSPMANVDVDSPNKDIASVQHEPPTPDLSVGAHLGPEPLANFPNSPMNIYRDDRSCHVSGSRVTDIGDQPAAVSKFVLGKSPPETPPDFLGLLDRLAPTNCDDPSLKASPHYSETTTVGSRLVNFDGLGHKLISSTHAEPPTPQAERLAAKSVPEPKLELTLQALLNGKPASSPSTMLSDAPSIQSVELDAPSPTRTSVLATNNSSTMPADSTKAATREPSDTIGPFKLDPLDPFIQTGPPELLSSNRQDDPIGGVAVSSPSSESNNSSVSLLKFSPESVSVKTPSNGENTFQELPSKKNDVKFDAVTETGAVVMDHLGDVELTTMTESLNTQSSKSSSHQKHSVSIFDPYRPNTGNGLEDKAKMDDSGAGKTAREVAAVTTTNGQELARTPTISFHGKATNPTSDSPLLGPVTKPSCLSITRSMWSSVAHSTTGSDLKPSSVGQGLVSPVEYEANCSVNNFDHLFALASTVESPRPHETAPTDDSLDSKLIPTTPCSVTTPPPLTSVNTESKLAVVAHSTTTEPGLAKRSSVGQPTPRAGYGFASAAVHTTGGSRSNGTKFDEGVPAATSKESPRLARMPMMPPKESSDRSFIPSPPDSSSALVPPQPLFYRESPESKQSLEALSSGYDLENFPSVGCQPTPIIGQGLTSAVEYERIVSGKFDAVLVLAASVKSRPPYETASTDDIVDSKLIPSPSRSDTEPPNLPSVITGSKLSTLAHSTMTPGPILAKRSGVGQLIPSILDTPINENEPLNESPMSLVARTSESPELSSSDVFARHLDSKSSIKKPTVDSPHPMKGLSKNQPAGERNVAFTGTASHSRLRYPKLRVRSFLTLRFLVGSLKPVST